MPSYHVVAESEHELQNPTSPEKIRLLGERMRLGSESSVLESPSLLSWLSVNGRAAVDSSRPVGAVIRFAPVSSKGLRSCISSLVASGSSSEIAPLLEDATTPALELGLEGPTAGEFNPRRDQG
jgi:hypothetical protein